MSIIFQIYSTINKKKICLLLIFTLYLKKKLNIMFVIQKKISSKIRRNDSLVNVSQLDEVLEFDKFEEAEKFLKSIQKKFTCEYKIKKI